jgi:hypothetical protein
MKGKDACRVAQLSLPGMSEVVSWQGKKKNL